MRAFDAIVVGAGIAGTATAWALRRNGLRVALPDTHAPGWGASGRNPEDAHQDSATFVRRLATDFVAAGDTVMAPARVASLAMTGDTCGEVVLALPAA